MSKALPALRESKLLKSVPLFSGVTLEFAAEFAAPATFSKELVASSKPLKPLITLTELSANSKAWFEPTKLEASVFYCIS